MVGNSIWPAPPLPPSDGHFGYDKQLANDHNPPPPNIHTHAHARAREVIMTKAVSDLIMTKTLLKKKAGNLHPPSPKMTPFKTNLKETELRDFP